MAADQDLTPIDGRGDLTEGTLRSAIKAIVEGVTGVAASGREEWALSLGHFLQRIRVRGFLRALLDEWQVYREKGRIKDDYPSTEQSADCLQEMLEFLEKDRPDQVRFEAIKSIFLTAATETRSTRDSVLPQEYMRLCRKLSSGEILLLEAAYRCGKSHEPDRSRIHSASDWLQSMAQASGLTQVGLVELHERALMEKNLLSKRLYGDQSGISWGVCDRLTDLGLALCEFISKGEPVTWGRDPQNSGEPRHS